MIRCLLAGAVLLTACQPRVVTVRVTTPDGQGVEQPSVGLSVTFLPYDRDSVLASLEAKAGPRPGQRELDSLYAAFRKPFRALIAIRGETDRLRLALDSLGPSAAQQPGRRQLTDSLARLTSIEAQARLALEEARASLGPSIDRLKEASRRWQDETYKSYRDVVRNMGERTFANPVADTTDANGYASIRLTDGQWWVTTNNIDQSDPNAEWYWNLRIDRDTVYLSPRTGRNRPRY